MNLDSNPNTRWAAIFVDELAANGLEAVCIAPGSRSTPLTLAFAAQPDIQIYCHLDERSAGFFALGLALATRRPIALVCTSGTAAANFHPAIIEAYYSHVPLLVLTADRPAELRGSGANQTIDQIKMYGDHVRWSVEMPTPQPDAPDVVLRHLRTLAARAYATADGLVKGPVHLNFPFRKPLEPGTLVSGPTFEDHTNKYTQPFTRIERGSVMVDIGQVASIGAAIKDNPRGLIVCGPECPAGDFPAAVVTLAKCSGYPILADALSNLRHGPHDGENHVIGGFHLWLSAIRDALGKPDIILRFGAVPTSSSLAAYLESTVETPGTLNIHIREDGEWADDLHLTREMIQANPTTFCMALAESLELDRSELDMGWLDQWRAAERSGWERINAAIDETAFFDGTAVRQVLMALNSKHALFAGNSMPVRHIDTFDRPDVRSIQIYGNRGASGIDGNVSTALGLAASGAHDHVVAILGDITFYHDMNGLLAVRQFGLRNITFVVINNDGGSIFHRLPIAITLADDPIFTDLFLTPHGLKFEHAAAMYGLTYRAVADEAGLAKALRETLEGTDEPMLIEVETNSAADYRYMRAVAAIVATEFQKLESPTDLS